MKLRLCAVLALIMTSANCGSGSPTPVAGAKLRSGEWEFVDKVLEIHSAGMSKSHIERLRRKADGKTGKLCIREEEVQLVTALLEPTTQNCTFEPSEIRDGIINSQRSCAEGDLTEEVTLLGGYDAQQFEVTSHLVASGSPNPVANIEYKIIRRGKWIGECSK